MKLLIQILLFLLISYLTGCSGNKQSDIESINNKQPEIMYSLHKQGPCTVYSGDLEPVNGDESLIIPEANVPIVKLEKGQAILVYAKAMMGNTLITKQTLFRVTLTKKIASTKYLSKKKQYPDHIKFRVHYSSL